MGNHTFRMVHMPGHTAFQAAVIVEEEGVVFTSDNVFCKVHTWLQEADPALWRHAPMVMKLNVANLCDYVTGAGIHSKGACVEGASTAPSRFRRSGGGAGKAHARTRMLEGKGRDDGVPSRRKGRSRQRVGSISVLSRTHSPDAFDAG